MCVFFWMLAPNRETTRFTICGKPSIKIRMLPVLPEKSRPRKGKGMAWSAQPSGRVVRTSSTRCRTFWISPWSLSLDISLCLPGALSAYRFHALQNDDTGHGPLSQYFKGETLHGQDADVFTANMYLAEDRILCWELVAKRDERWVLEVRQECDLEKLMLPDTVPEFISQRRRWLNGAFFAAVYSLLHFTQVWKTDHTIARKCLLHIEFVYQFINFSSPSSRSATST